MKKKEILDNTEKIAIAWGIYSNSEFYKPGVEYVREQFNKLFLQYNHLLPRIDNWEVLIKCAESRELEREKQSL